MAGSIQAFLRSNPLFAGLPAREIDALAAVAREETRRPREYVLVLADVEALRARAEGEEA